ncbi:type II secretion system protein [Pseudoalteromonas sp. T1lg65]|uniref:type II secretion system protein n=1 Tax=Pseudoalteromonas sp. T1lg65 TaxID=2077101 RepID=UPI003F78B1E0
MIELLIVLTIMGLIMSLVAPLSLKAINRSDAKMELVEAKNWVRNQANRAFTQQRDYLVVFDKNKGSIFHNQAEVATMHFDYLTFPHQQLIINRFGVSSQNTISANYQQQSLNIELQSDDAL